MKKSLIHLFLVVVILFITLHSSSQSLYEIKFRDKQNIQYSCFLVFFHENNAYMRIAYTHNNTPVIVNVTYKVKNGTTTDGAKYSMLSGSNPEFIMGADPQRSYNPDYFIWFYNTAARKWDTPYTTDDTLLRAKNYVTVDSYLELTPGYITDAYLKKFFRTYESKYFAMRKMCGLTTVTLPPISTTKPAKLHLVVVANTYDASIGNGCSTDAINLKNEFRQVAKALNIPITEYVVDGSTFSKEKVMSTLNGVYPGSNDIVLFVYRGHGFRWKDQASDWPRMDLRSNSYDQTAEINSMNLHDVYNTLTAKGARLNIILGDCCNSEVNVSPVTLNNYLTFQVDNNSDISKLRKLFLNTKGTILSASARKGEVSWVSTQGGLYSISFLQALREEISYFNSGTAGWDNILNKTINLARTKSTKTYCSNCSLQNGIKYVSVVNY